MAYVEVAQRPGSGNAGADMVETDTLSATSVSQAERSGHDAQCIDVQEGAGELAESDPWFSEGTPQASIGQLATYRRAERKCDTRSDST